jgi:hypothetical protein
MVIDDGCGGLSTPTAFEKRNLPTYVRSYTCDWLVLSHPETATAAAAALAAAATIPKRGLTHLLEVKTRGNWRD